MLVTPRCLGTSLSLKEKTLAYMCVQLFNQNHLDHNKSSLVAQCCTYKVSTHLVRTSLRPAWVSSCCLQSTLYLFRVPAKGLRGKFLRKPPNRISFDSHQSISSSVHAKGSLPSIRTHPQWWKDWSRRHT